MIPLTWEADSYALARTLFQRTLAVVYLIAFLNAALEFRPLLGRDGLLPAVNWIRAVPFRESPSLFYFGSSDSAFRVAAWLGVLISCAVILGIPARFSWTSALAWALMWVLYLSFVNIGRTFYGFGWESILLEAGFYAIFLGGRSSAPQWIGLLLVRWLCFRVMFGAGLIKLRGDPCWRDYTCLDYHYETQPMPNPLSWYFHWAPQWTHRAGVGFNHFAELVAPFGLLLPQPIASIAAVITILFQATIMASGNLSWLNFLTMVIAIPAIDDRALALLLPWQAPTLHAPSIGFKAAVALVGLLVAWLSIDPIRNMLSPRQIMNTTFNPFHLVGTYGAFGGITRERYEVVIEGTRDGNTWQEYEFRGKPGDPFRIPPQVAPYHLRLDWLMWFAAMSDSSQHPWFPRLLQKLLQGDPDTLGLLRRNPFTAEPPQSVRARYYRYKFTTPDEHRATGRWWSRQLIGEYFPAVSRAEAARAAR
jgi:hypothetical protein